MGASREIEIAVRSMPELPEGVDRRILCPACAASRKPHNRRQKTLSLKRTGDRVLYNCHHCGEASSLSLDPPENARRKNLQEQPLIFPLTAEALKFLKGRGIGRETAERFGVFSTRAWFRKLGRKGDAIGFPYKNADGSFAAKLRCIELKDHIAIGAPRSFFGFDMIEDIEKITIVEGEFDVLAMAEAGIGDVVSVPNGAVSRVSERVRPEEDTKFRYLWEAKEFLANLDRICLAGDMDPQGELLTEELARRLNKTRCWRVTWPGRCKDANETLLTLGKDAVVEAVEAAERYPVAGLFEATAFSGKVEDLFRHGAGKGVGTGFHSVDEIFTVVPGSLNIVTGLPGSGKSEFLDQIAVNIASRRDWSVAMASFENEPPFHIAKLMSKRVGKHFFTGPTPRMTEEERTRAFDWVNDRFSFVSHNDGSMATVDDIIERLEAAVVRHGVNMAVIDPINYIERPRDVSETDWVSETLTRFRVFAQAYEVALFLVAHPRMMYREGGKTPIPGGYDISGSSNYFNKADFGLTVHREQDQPFKVKVRNWKTRWAWAGKVGDVELTYDAKTTTYQEPSAEPWYDDD